MKKNLWLIGAGVLGAALLLGRKKAEASEDSAESGASLDVAIYDEQGNHIMGLSRGIGVWDPGSGGSLNEGGTYNLVFSVKNNSTRGGVAWPVSFDLYRAVQLTGYAFPMEEFLAGGAFQPGETRTFSKTFTLPMGSGGASGYIKVQVFPAGALNPIVASFEKAFTVPVQVAQADIIYGATIVINPI